MAAFDLSDPEQFQRLDWKILQNGAVSLYRDSVVLEADCEWFRNYNYREHRFDETTWLKRENFFVAMNQQLALPYSSGN